MQVHQFQLRQFQLNPANDFDEVDYMAKLQIKYVPIDALKVNPRNPRVAPTKAILAIKDSIREFGWTNPILVQKSNNLVIAGHQRIKAAKLAGLKEVPIIYLDLDDVKSLAYNIADNKLAELTDWNERELSRILESLNNDVDLTLLGFNKEDLDMLIPELAEQIKGFEEELNEALNKVGTTNVRAPVVWMGSKSHLATWIISHFPEHSCYVEPFGGAASVLLRKERVKSEVYNDLNHFVYNFFKCIRDQPKHLLSALAFLPHSRQLYDELRIAFKKGSVHPGELVLQAACWYHLQQSSFAGHWGTGWAHGAKGGSVLRNTMNRLWDVAMRLQGVQIENSDFRKIFETYDTETTLFYVDPPYITHEHYYPKTQVEPFTLDDHKDLAQILNNIQGKACVSYYPSPFVDVAYKGWRRTKKTVRAWAKGVTKQSKTGRRPFRTELLLMNY